MITIGQEKIKEDISREFPPYQLDPPFAWSGNGETRTRTKNQSVLSVIRDGDWWKLRFLLKWEHIGHIGTSTTCLWKICGEKNNRRRSTPWLESSSRPSFILRHTISLSGIVSVTQSLIFQPVENRNLALFQICQKRSNKTPARLRQLPVIEGPYQRKSTGNRHRDKDVSAIHQKMWKPTDHCSELCRNQQMA